MKTTCKLFLALTALFVSTTLLSCSEKNLTPDQLPDAAQAFIKEHFPESTIFSVKKDTEISGITYEVKLKDGTEIDFNKQGEWIKVDCRNAAVPGAIVPALIAEYVQTNFPDEIIVEIDKEPFGYEIELGNSLDLRFDSDGQLINQEK